ncbi:hypothetical protein [Enterococcus sp. BWR-S5]|uniref:hypothetical protein n=1 Tax=Enterococcus sp. BWR-S5 TaxID=2787714 RepID=UPI001924A875|nr:hypothetical protein [Enterococcus sp. BWR-S5]MBL1225305.1 hypothetical protein [Enterococcus sp. BWR-S5]
MKKYMQRESLFMRQYYDIFSNERSMSCHEEYYKALVHFIKRNDRYFSKEIVKAYNLNVLMTLELEKYPIAPSIFSLTQEQVRCSGQTYSSVGSLAMSISNILWEMVAVYSGKDCPIINEYNMRYALVEDLSGEAFIVEECEQCGYLQGLTGQPYGGTVKKISPATMSQIEQAMDRKK